MLYRLVLAAHLACAFGATAVFWIPLAAEKGGPLHIRAGRIYARLIYLTALTGAPLAALLAARGAEPGALHTAAFLVYLIAILVMPVHHGIRVVRSARTGTPVASWLHSALSIFAITAGLALAAGAIRWRLWPYLLVSPIGPVMGLRALIYARRSSSRIAFAGWREEHIVSMVMSGIAVHTAMLVFGTTRTLRMHFTGVTEYVPWLLPAMIGVPLLVWRVKRERGASAR